MDSVAVTVPLRQPTKKMKKRKELDALAPPHTVSRRSSGKRSSQELLSDSSDERSEYWNVSTRNGRKCRGRRSRGCPGFFKACSAFLACASVLATASLIWLFIDVRQQLTALRTELDQVIAGNEGVPDALQKCHSLSRDLQNNQTIIFSQLSDLKLQVNNFTTQLAVIQRDLHRVEEWFKAGLEPTDLKALSSSVVSFGSQIQDLSATVKSLKESNARVQDAQTTMQQNITSIKNAITEMSNVTQRPQIVTTNETKIRTDELNAAILRLTTNLIHVNESLTRAVQWVAEDQKKDHETLVLLQETSQNVSMKVISLETECVKTTVLASVKKLNDQVAEIYVVHADLNDRVKHLEQSYGTLRNSTSVMLAGIPDIQGPKPHNAKDLKESIVGDTTTEQIRSGLALDDISARKPLPDKQKRSIGTP
ncbi:PREDICTED: uncharacterized protein LOC107186011 [Dufourea novaeangliae]|uniref:uncharacterized protein LOC107186011 n=1 Tax=Dufourea novaeangliae TaxID=178035 RepID=UPI000766E758|nr:PREDICTED: uncharacterized protein LOC107186011 [Dufourea novaeangliae]